MRPPRLSAANVKTFVRRSIGFSKAAYLQKTWLALEEAARYASISLQTLRDLRNEGLPTAERGGRKYVEREELDAFIGGK